MSKNIEEINIESYNILTKKLDKKFYCLNEFCKLFLNDDDIIDLFISEKKSPKQNINILPVLIMFNEYVSFEAKGRLKKNKEKWDIIKTNFFKLIQQDHYTILGTQVDGFYQILDIADENNFLCRKYSEIPMSFKNSIYFAENNVLLPIDFISMKFPLDASFGYWDNQDINLFEEEYLEAIKKGDGCFDFSLH